MEKILVVDDEVLVLETLREFLSAIGYEVETAENGLDAIKKVKEMKPDLVLLDIIMPGMGGIDVLKEIREMDIKVRIIMLTAVADEEIVKRALQLGAHDYFTKPVNLSRLKDVMAAIRLEKILVVDDEVLVLETLREFLTATGYAVQTADNGPDAIKKVKEMKPDLILLDIIMPGMGGMDVLKEIRKIDPHVGVIMVTALADEEIAKRAIHLGAYDYVTKPLNLRHLEEVVLVKLADRD